jgi:pyruvate dehydrogenase E2 component (dihydrolipoamide acetyltransferase)
MAIPIIMPKQGQSVETCIITRWFKKKGDPVKTGDLLFSYETDKAAFDVESPADGILLDIFYGDGAEVPVLLNVAVIGDADEVIEEFVAVKSDNIQTEKAEESIQNQEEVKPDFIGEKSVLFKETVDQKIRISPRAKRYADSKGIDYNNIKGSGPNGRIVCSDVEKVISGSATGDIKNVQPATDVFVIQPLTNVRKAIAKAMYDSLRNSAQLTHHMSADVRSLLEARRKIKEGVLTNKEQQDITINAMVCWCLIRALEKFPEINSHFLGDEMKIFKRIHLGIAVDTERGLLVPALKNADTLDLLTLSRELKSLAEKCRKGSINPDLIHSTAASFTVSNLGNYGVEMFTPVINLPQSAILGVCAIINRPADLGNNVFGFVPYMGLSLTYDHRAVDGGPATLFLKEVKNQIEKFTY